jgi:hypothetical protein
MREKALLAPMESLGGLAAALAMPQIWMMSPAIKELFEQVASWPQEDQEDLAEVARKIEARRTGVYGATPEELQALDEAERSGIASDEEVEAAFRSFRRR